MTLLMLLLFSVLTQTQQKVNGNVRQIDGKGVAGVVVSDGFSVVKTGNKGEFSFDVSEKAKFVYISTPSGYVQRSPFYMSIAGNNPKMFEFKVEHIGKQPDKFIHIGDPEESIYKNYMDGLKEYISNHKISFLMLNGDICYEKGMNFHSREVTDSSMGVRMVYTLGNHDLVAGDRGEQTYEKHFGPVYYSFNVNNVHFVVTPVFYGDKAPSYTADDVWNWLKKDLDALPAGTPVVFANHHFYGLSDDFLMKTPTQSFNFKDYNIKGYLYAHYHTNLFFKGESGISTYSSMSPNKGGIDHSPSSFRVISFDKKGNLDSELKYATLKNHIAATAFAKPGGLQVVATIYNTGSEVVMADILIGHGSYKLLKKSDWCWGTDLSAKVSSMIKDGDKMRVKVRFSDGSVATGAVDIKKEVKWSVNLGALTFMTSPVVAGNVVVMATTDDEKAKKCSIHGVDKETGEILWSLVTNNSVKGNMAYCDGKLLACDIIGRVYAIDPSNGKLIWFRDIREKTIHPVLSQGVVAYKGIVYAGLGASLTALKVDTGEILWVNKDWKGGVSTVAASVVDPASGVLLTGAYWTGRFANDATTGKMIWEKRDDDSRICDNSPVVYNGHFFYTSPDYITEVEPLTGKELIKQKISCTVNTNSRPVVNDKYYIVGSADKGVAAFDRKNGYKDLWTFRTNPALIYTAPYTKDFQMTVECGCALVRDNLYFGANDGYLYSLNVANGLFRSKINLGSPVLGNVVVDGNSLFVSDFGGNLWSVRLFE